MLKDRIWAATKKIKSDLVLENIQVVDVFGQDIFCADVAVKDGIFVGTGRFSGCGKKTIDGTGRYIIPGLIDAHAHIESTLVTPVEYGNASLAHGITSVIADPHEIANVAGTDGIRFMIEAARRVPMDIYFMLPSCVPATSFENAGARLDAEDLKPFYQEPEVQGLAEVMDYPAVLEAAPRMLEKLTDAVKADAVIDGHGPGFGVDQLNAYAVAQIRTDHECDTEQGLVDRVRRGIYTLVREGTVCKDLLNMLPVITEKNSRLLCFATDDKHLDDLLLNGGVNNNVKLAIKNGLNPVIAIQMATINAATCYRLKNKGAVAPGYVADFSIVSDLDNLVVDQVYKNGILVAQHGKRINPVDPETVIVPDSLATSINIPKLKEADLEINMAGSTRANIIEVTPGSVVSNHLVETVDVENGQFKINVPKDQLKIAVIERHRCLGNIACGIIKGLCLETGAIATTIAHDSHNLIVVGCNEADMLAAVQAVETMQGGIAIVDHQKTVSALTLEIGGLMTARKAEQVVADLHHLQRTLERLAPRCTFNPILALSFMSLIVIPDLKISDQGLFDVRLFQFIDVLAGGSS